VTQLDDNVQRLRQLIEDYSATRDPLLERLEVSGPFDRDALWKSNLVQKPGCYVIYCEDGSRKYTGKSESSVGNRIRDHLSPAEQASPFWQKGPSPTHFCIIATPAQEARKLEDYLISRDYY
jgi:hypothetical protein